MTAYQAHLLTQLRGKGRSYSLVSKSRLPSLVEKVWASPRSRAFAQLLEADTPTQALFLQHWKQLSFLEDFSLPIYFSCVDEEAPDVMQASASAGGAQLGFTVERILRDARPQLEDLMERFADRLKGVAKAGAEPSEAELMSVVLQFFGVFGSGDPKKALFGILRPFEDYFADELPDIIALILAAVSGSALSAGFMRRRALLQNSALSIAEYEATVSRLTNLGYLNPILSIYWCSRHGQYPRTYLLSGYPNVPKSLTCDLCGRTLRGSAYLLPSTPAMTFARRYEGAMAALMAWDLERNEIPWNSSVFLEGVQDTEKDLVFCGSKRSGVSIVECKSFYRDTVERVRKDNLSGLLHQLERHVESYVGKGIRVGTAILATNYPVEPSLTEFVADAVKSKTGLAQLRKVGVKLVGQGNLSDWWKVDRPVAG